MSDHPAFSVWAPRAAEVRLVIREVGREPRLHDYPMLAGADGWWTPDADLAAGLTGREVDYGYRIDGQGPYPDPRSRAQPGGVHDLSRSVDPSAFPWTDSDWTGRRLAGSVIYELHIGTFTAAGTLDAAIERLPHLVGLGADLVELLPVNAFNGEWNWGYDGVLWFAVQQSYGGPAAYQRFVDAAHRAGLGVIQDVVYNHLGPSGNYLPEFGPYLADQGTNTWGALLNLDGPGSDEVNRFILDNAAMWFDDYHVDGLRLDAVHALVDHRAMHLLEELAIETAARSAHLRRPLSLIAESDLNDPRLISPREAGGYGLHAQWSDDFHHAVHVLLTGETTGYYADFADPDAVRKVLEEGFYHDGSLSSFRGRRHGRPVDRYATSAWRFVVSTQNHDQIGNRAAGDRLSASLDDGALAIAATLTILGPFTPMLFMGEEWAASTPWQFFTSHPEPELGEATAKGRIAEFARMGWDPAIVPDPQDPATFQRSKLRWEEVASGRHARLHEWYRTLLQLRRLLPEATDPSMFSTSVSRRGTRITLLRGPTRIELDVAASPSVVISRGGEVLASFG